MQTHAPDAIDISKETDATRKLYGVGEKPTDYFGRQLLMARRLVERGVRYVQIFSGGGNFEPSWDAHWDLKDNHGLHCAETDKPIAGLIKDLKSRGMFDSTLIVWHGEFGRLPISRAHVRAATTTTRASRVWLAGGGVKGGTMRRRRPTSTATRRSRTRSRSTSCTRRSCTCSGWTTRSSPTASTAATCG